MCYVLLYENHQLFLLKDARCSCFPKHNTSVMNYKRNLVCQYVTLLFDQLITEQTFFELLSPIWTSIVVMNQITITDYRIYYNDVLKENQIIIALQVDRINYLLISFSRKHAQDKFNMVDSEFFSLQGFRLQQEVMGKTGFCDARIWVCGTC